MVDMDDRLDIRKLFRDWVEPEIAHYYLACLIGIMVLDESKEGWFRVRGVFNTNNPVSTCLFQMLEQAVAGGMLEENDDFQYRWNPAFEKNLDWNQG